MERRLGGSGRGPLRQRAEQNSSGPGGRQPRREQSDGSPIFFCRGVGCRPGSVGSLGSFSGPGRPPTVAGAPAMPQCQTRPRASSSDSGTARKPLGDMEKLARPWERDRTAVE